MKQLVTARVDDVILTMAKERGSREGIQMSQVIRAALNSYGEEKIHFRGGELICDPIIIEKAGAAPVGRPPSRKEETKISDPNKNPFLPVTTTCFRDFIKAGGDPNSFQAYNWYLAAGRTMESKVKNRLSWPMNFEQRAYPLTDVEYAIVYKEELKKMPRDRRYPHRVMMEWDHPLLPPMNMDERPILRLDTLDAKGNTFRSYIDSEYSIYRRSMTSTQWNTPEIGLIKYIHACACKFCDLYYDYSHKYEYGEILLEVNKLEEEEDDMWREACEANGVDPDKEESA